MNLKILFMLLIYYTLISLFFLFGSATLTEEGYTTTVNLNDTSIQLGEEEDRGGLFATGISFGRFFSFVAFGIGLPEDTPNWFSATFFLWQTLLAILTVGFIISSIWDG